MLARSLTRAGRPEGIEPCAVGLFLLVTQMLPEALVVIPAFVIFRQLGMLESLTGVALLDEAFAAPIGILILKNLFDTVPREVMEAALIDGGGSLGILRRVVLPLSKPGLVAVGVVAFFFAWDEFLFASTMITKHTLRPASVGLSTLMGITDAPIERILACGLVFALPPMLFYMVLQRYIVAGLSAGAVKG